MTARIEAKLRKLAADCGECRGGFHCGRCLCCLPEADVRALVQKAQLAVVPKPRAPKMHSIVLSTSEVCDVLDGLKSQTRRVMKPQPSVVGGAAKSPLGNIGGRLWVREKWCYEADPVTDLNTGRFLYAARDSFVVAVDDDGGVAETKEGWEVSPWQSSTSMPRAAARIYLEVTAISIEQLNDIRVADARREGLSDEYVLCYGSPVLAFKNLWDRTAQGRRHPWRSNPWVWAYTFRVVTP